MRRTLGTAVFAGMLGVTLFGIFLTPVFYYVIQWFNDRMMMNEALAEADETNGLVVSIPHTSSNGAACAWRLLASAHAKGHKESL